MSRKQIDLIGLVMGVLLFSTTLFRQELFLSGNLSIYLFVILLSSGLLLIFVALWRLLGFRARYGVLALILFEVGLAVSFQSIAKLQVRRTPSEIGEFLSLVYDRGFMNSVQFDKTVSYFDPGLQYRFKPGVHDFNNIEFKSVLHVNSGGFRDRETALNHPRVVFLGDSYTMGWGVSDDESFPRLFGNEMEVSCLNAGISSYGTARERILMDHLSLDSCQLLFIQYCSNDLVENYMFFRNDGRLASEKELKEGYDLYVRMNTLLQHYYPFKHVYWLFKGTMMYSGFAAWLDSKRNQGAEGGNTDEKGPGSDEHGIYVENVLRSIRQRYKGEIVFYMLDSFYPAELTAQLQSAAANPELGIHWLDMSKAGLERNDYFLLDSHINTSGHRKVADALISFVREKGMQLDVN